MTLSTSSADGKIGSISVPTASEKAEAMSRILSSETFLRAKRSKQLFEFLTHCEGSKVPCTQYDIADAVFGRSSNFDAGYDSLVRVQISRLRGTLQKYYEGEGANDDILVALPKGSYHLTFSYIDEASNLHSGAVLSRAADGSKYGFRHRCSDMPTFIWDHSYSLIFVALLMIIVAVLGTYTSTSENDNLSALPSSNEVVRSGNNVRAVVLEKCDSGARQFESQSGTISNVIVAGLIDRIKRSKVIEIYAGHEKAKISPYPSEKYCFVLKVQSVENENLISFHLVRNQTGRLVWAKNFWVTDQAMLSNKDSIINALSAKLQSKLYALSANVTSSGKHQKTPKELFLMSTWIPGHTKDQFQWHRERILLAEQALKIDPNYGPAHSVLADKIAYLSSFYDFSDLALNLESAKEHAERALELSPDDADVILNIANYYFHSGDMSQYKFYVERALELAPHHPIARITRNQISCRTASNEMVADMIELDRQLDPGDQLRWLTLQTLGEIYLDRGDLQKAVSASAKSHAIFRSPVASMRYAALLAASGENTKAIEVFHRNARNWPNISLEKYVRETISARCRGGDEVAKVNQFNAYNALLKLIGSEKVPVPVY